MNIPQFQKVIWNYYKKNKRNFPWRNTKDPYKILVSEIMLQQTQAPRVVPKYNSFIKRFPTLKSLADTKLSEVLREWQGLGYNRRAKYLKMCAETVVRKYGGKFPKDFNKLVEFPGIGPATAGDLMAFAWNMPVVVIETNIRSVFIHHFFSKESEKRKIHDKEILPLIEKILDKKKPREWYSALMDYGAYLKETSNPGRKSAHYAKQSPFKGSNREKRSKILKLILQKPRTEKEIFLLLKLDKEIASKITQGLMGDGLIVLKHKKLYIK